MRNILITISFKGTKYHGSQFQKTKNSIMDKFQKAYISVMGEQDKLTACSRTDSGVHANEFCISVKTERLIGYKNLRIALNTKLPDDIAVLNCVEVDENFHARYSAKGKRYIYKIWNSEIKNPFLIDQVYRYRQNMDIEMLNRQCKYFIGKHDFKAFSANRTTIEDTTREIYDCYIEKQGDMVIFVVEGDGFLYNMVRIMVGTIIHISANKIPQDTIPDIIKSLDRNKVGNTAPAQGLYLDKVYY